MKQPSVHLTSTPQSSLNAAAASFQPAGSIGMDQLPDGGDITDPKMPPTIDELVDKLLDPPATSYPGHHGHVGSIYIHLGWVQKKIGEPHFVNDKELSRSVLKPNSKIRTHG